MQTKIKFYKLSELDNMLCNIREEGQYDVWEEIENTKDALKRIHQRDLFNIAIIKLGG